MPLEDFIIVVCVVVDDWFRKLPHPLRERGYPSAFTDAEVVTPEIVAEYMEPEQDKQAWQYFTRHWRAWFPGLPCRTTYVRQCANLWEVKQPLQAALCHEMGALDSRINRVDGFPVPLCHFKRAPRCRLFEAEMAHGHCASKNTTYYGFQGLVIVSSTGVVTGFTVMAANHDEIKGLYECLSGNHGLPEGNKGFTRPLHKATLRRMGLNLQTPLLRNMRDERPEEYVKELMRDRRLVETVIGQLTERFNIQKLRAGDPWHLTVRI